METKDTQKVTQKMAQKLPASWRRAAGIFRRHKKSMEESARQTRVEWRDRYGH